jgi:hypothetical protein
MSHPYLSAILPGQGLGIPGPVVTQGQAFFVNPYYGIGDGKKPNRAFTSLSTALDKLTAGHNDVVYMLGASNTAAYTTDYQSANLDWDVDLSHIIGVGAGQWFSPRARIAFASTYDTASNLFTVSANGCRFQGLQFYEGVAGTNPTGCVSVTGNRNVFYGCHLAGIGHDNNDIANAYSLYVSGQENVFERCVIGLDSIDRGTAANSEIYFAAGALRNYFKDCLIIGRIQHNTNSPHVRCAGGAMGNPGSIAIFDNCKFISSATNYGYTQTYAIVFTAAPTAGLMYVVNCSTNASNWGAAGNHLLIHNSVSNTGYNQGLAYSS